MTAPVIIVYAAARWGRQDRQVTVSQESRCPPVDIRRTPSPWQDGQGATGTARATGAAGGAGSGSPVGSHPM